jgi:primosomal protein N'
MKLLKVIPISRGIHKENLSYFTVSDIPIGSIIKVPLRKKIVPAIIISAEDVTDVKTEIKNASFETKKIISIQDTNKKNKFIQLLSPDFIDTIRETAKYFCATSGSVLYSITPKIIFENPEKVFTKDIKKINISNKICNKRSHEKLIIQNEDEERYATYKSLIREEFAKGYSVFFCLPTIQDIKTAYEKLSKGIEQYTFILHGNLNKKDQINTWNKTLAENHPVLVICTGSFLGIPRDDIGTIIIDKENSRAYKNISRPFVDIRIFANILAKNIQAKIVYGDLLLKSETIWKHHESEIFEIIPLKFRSLNTSLPQIINMKGSVLIEDNQTSISKKSNKEEKFKLFSEPLLEIIRNNQDNDENLFIFTTRRGLFPSTVCGDCGSLVKCNNCQAPTVLHKSNQENFFLCHRCGEHRDALEKCQNCQSWKLITLGIGIESAEEELLNKFPKAKVFRLDSDIANTNKKARDIMEKFYNSPGSILLGTEMALLYLKETIANSAILSMDSLFSIPDFRINEKIMNILLKIRSHTSRNFLIQTRDSEQKIFNYAALGNLADFYREEIKERKTLFYPPFSTLIKITLQGDKKSVLSNMEKLQKKMEPYELDIFPAFIPINKGKFNMHALIKIRQGDWVDENLLEKLYALPPEYTINIDPESLL